MSLRKGGPEGSLKWHTKSRNGCQTCKSRKVKCDEHHPSCRNCMRRGVKCDFLDSKQIISPIQSPPNLELELLHNFTVSTASTLAAAPLVRDLWRVFVPQVGFRTRYILDSILAISALHMARHNPHRREMLLATATFYHTASLQEALPLIPNITSENCSNLFIFGVLTLFITLASPRKNNDILVVGNGVIPEWLFLLRGMDAMIDAQAETLLSSPAAAIFRTSGVGCEFCETDQTPSENIVLAELESRIRSTVSERPAEHDALLKAIESLNRSYTFLASGAFGDEDRLRGIYRWLFEISDEYLKLLKDGDSKALCILAFFSVLVRSLEKYWWVEGWAVHLIARIYDLLDENYRLWIRWPIEEIGWVPEPSTRYASQGWSNGGSILAGADEK